MKLKRISKEYDFYVHGTTQSMADKWMTCPRQCYLEYIKLWTTNKFNASIEFGNFCHYVLEQAYSSIHLPMPSDVAGWVMEYARSLESDNDSADIVQEKEIIAGKAEAIMLQYMVKYCTDWQVNWEIAETIFRIPFKFHDGKITYLNGKLDGGFRQEKYDDLVLMDHKCKGQWNLDNLGVLLPADLQMNFYIYCVWKWNELHDWKPYFPKGFYYNLIRNPGLRPGKDTLDEFITRIRKDVEHRSSHYFQREYVPCDQRITEKWVQNQLTPLLYDIRKWYDTNYQWPRYYKSSSLETRYGLAPMARAIILNDFAGLHQRDTFFPELVR